MKVLTVAVFSLCLITIGVQSASACNAISTDVAQLGNALNGMSGDSLGDMVVCAAEATISNDRARKNYYLEVITKIEAYIGNVTPEIDSALEQIKAALIK